MQASSFFFVIILSFSTKLFVHFEEQNDGKWYKQVKMITHKHCHDKSMPLTFTSHDLSLYLLGFPLFKCYASCCHLTLNENRCHPSPLLRE
jgi:hypothetical protein